MKFTLDDIKNSSAGKLNQHLFEESSKLSAPKSACAKYRNNKVYWDGMTFDSKKEYRRYRELLLLQKAGKIFRLHRQTVFLLIPAQEGEKATKYKSDHDYWTDTGEYIVEDVKSVATRKLSTYILKRKLMLKVHGIKIKEV